jgi:hypothetical protein
MGWDNHERYPRTKKDALHLSFISFGISHSRISDFGISFLALGYPRVIPKTSKDTPGISSTWPYPWPILETSNRYPKTSRFILGVGIPDDRRPSRPACRRARVHAAVGRARDRLGPGVFRAGCAACENQRPAVAVIARERGPPTRTASQSEARTTATVSSCEARHTVVARPPGSTRWRPGRLGPRQRGRS